MDVPKPWAENNKEGNGDDNKFPQWFFWEQATVHEIEERLYDEHEEKEIVGENTKYIYDKIANPGIPIVSFINWNEEILTQDGKQGHQTVHTDFISIPIHKGWHCQKRSTKNSNAWPKCTFTQKIDGRNWKNKEDQRKDATRHDAVAQKQLPEVQDEVIEWHVHILADDI